MSQIGEDLPLKVTFRHRGSGVCYTAGSPRCEHGQACTQRAPTGRVLGDIHTWNIPPGVLGGIPTRDTLPCVLEDCLLSTSPSFLGPEKLSLRHFSSSHGSQAGCP